MKTVYAVISMGPFGPMCHGVFEKEEDAEKVAEAKDALVDEVEFTKELIDPDKVNSYLEEGGWVPAGHRGIIEWIHPERGNVSVFVEAGDVDGKIGKEIVDFETFEEFETWVKAQSCNCGTVGRFHESHCNLIFG